MSTKKAAPQSRAARSAEKRNNILEVAAELFAENGFAGTTVRDIGRRVELFSGSLYHYFDSKEALAGAIVARYWTDLLEHYERISVEQTSPAHRLRSLIQASNLLIEKHERALKFQMNDWHYLVEFLPEIDQNMSIIQKVWTDVIAEGIRDGSFRSDLDPVIVYRIIMGSLSGTGRWYQPGAGDIQISQISDTMIEVFLKGVEQ